MAPGGQLAGSPEIMRIHGCGLLSMDLPPRGHVFVAIRGELSANQSLSGCKYRRWSPRGLRLEQECAVLPIPTTALKLADTVAGKLGLLDRRFAADELIRRARRRTGLEDFGDVDLGEPLRRFLDACVDDAWLSVVGRFATRWDVVRFLSNLLLLRAAERAHPEILARADRAADLHHRPAAQRHHVPAPADDGGSGQSRAAGLADDLSLSAAADRRRPAGGAGGAAAAHVRAARPGVPRAAPAGRDLAAGMQRDHRARVPQPALRHQPTTSRPTAPGWMPIRRPCAGLPVPPAVPAASAAPGWSPRIAPGAGC